MVDGTAVDVGPKTKCISCNQVYVDKDGVCAQCEMPQPWRADIEDLRGEIRSREVSRFRATFTLIEEAVAAARGGKPISIAAVKGFAFSWMFPRVFIALGSLTAALILMVQTFILWQQKEVMDRQHRENRLHTQLVELQHEEFLRGRIIEISQAYKPLLRSPPGFVSGLVERPLGDAPFCDQDKECLLKPLPEAISGDSSHASATFSPSQLLGLLSEATTSGNGSLVAMRKSVYESVEHCGLPPSEYERLDAAVRDLEQISMLHSSGAKRPFLSLMSARAFAEVIAFKRINELSSTAERSNVLHRETAASVRNTMRKQKRVSAMPLLGDLVLAVIQAEEDIHAVSSSARVRCEELLNSYQLRQISIRNRILMGSEAASANQLLSPE